MRDGAPFDLDIAPVKSAGEALVKSGAGAGAARRLERADSMANKQS